MALIKCSECQTDVSANAFTCPKCGAELKRPTRSLFGKICLWFFVGFNIIMALWVAGGLSHNANQMQGMSAAEQTGFAIGTGIGIALLLMLWVVGDVILGLFALLTRPRRA